MRIHTKLTAQQIHKLTEETTALSPYAGQNVMRSYMGNPVGLFRIARRGSRSHERAFDIRLQGNARHGLSAGYSNEGHGVKAAHFDEVGIFLALLFIADPDAKVTGAIDYDGEVEFHERTRHRYTGGQLNGEPCAHHKWNRPYPGSDFQACYDCDAEFAPRWMDKVA